jgi:glycosyltransferase involved in cell wall biosynthesis
MNVWLVNQYAIPPTQPGITRHFSLAATLNRRGHDVTLIASSFDHVTRKETRLEPAEMFRLETIEGVRFLWLRTPPYEGNTRHRVWNMLVFAWRVWRRHGCQELPLPDVIVGSSPHLFGAFAAWRLARALGVPFVLEVRDLWPEMLVQWGDIRAGHPVFRVLAWIEQTLYRNSAWIITLWQHTPPYIAARGGDPGRISWISNGVFLDAILPQPPRKDACGPLTIMYLGAHSLTNPLHTVLDTAALLQAEGYADKVRFRFFGDGPNKSALIERAQRAGLDEMVRFEAPVPKQRVSTVITEADAFILPLHHGGLYRWGMSPNKLFDYMAAARPIVIAVDVPNPVAEAGAGLTVPAENAKAMAEAIKKLLALAPEERWEMGLRGRRYVEAHHDMARLAERFEACLQGAIRRDRIARDTEPLPSTPAKG